MRYNRKRVGRRLRQTKRNNKIVTDLATTMGALALGAGKSAMRSKIPKNKLVRIPRTQVKRKERGDGAYGQYTKESIVRGKRKPEWLVMKKGLKSTMERLVFGFKGIKSFDDHGFYGASKSFGGTNLYYLPMWVFDLTSVIQNGTQQWVPFKRAVTDRSGGNDARIKWINEQGVNDQGVTVTGANAFQLIESPGFVSSATAVPHNESLLRWTQIKMNCWGAKKKPTKYTIQVVKILDEQLDPWSASGETNIPPAGVYTNANHNRFWQAMVHGYTYNPISIPTNPLRSKMKVLLTKEFIIDPTSTTETDTDAHVKQLNVFNRWDRNLVYKEGRTSDTFGVLTDDAQFDQPVESTQDGRVASNTPSQNSRIFLLIRAMNTTPYSEGAPFSTDTDPSFDLSVKMCHTTFA